MKKIAIIAFLLAVSVAAGRAQESRQDISLSGFGLIEPFVASSTNVYVHSTPAYGALLSYRFMLTPSSALEANYGITYQNKIHFVTNPLTPTVLTRTQEISAAYVRSFNFRKFNPFVEGGGAGLIFLPIRNSGTTTLDARQQTQIGLPLWRRHRLRDQPQLRHPRRIPRPGHQGADLRCSQRPDQDQQVVQHLRADARRGIPLLIAAGIAD